MPPPPTYEEICDVARQAVSIFRRNGYECCLFGSTACALYGVSRCPNDVDLIVLASEVTEDLKHVLTSEDNNFFLVPSRNPSADYEVLWYRLPRTRGKAKRKCKVDILVPGTLNIPNVPPTKIKLVNHLPVIQLLPLLLLKLQGWTDHRNSNRRDFQEKQYVDTEDIEELLSITCDSGTHIESKALGWLPGGFVQDAQERIYEYVEEFPDSTLYWEALGFESE